jgi:hypothetical protein
METTPISLPWIEVLKLILGTGIVAAIVTQLISWIRESRKELISSTRDARYLAIRIAVILEGFAIACAESISQYDFYKQSAGHAGKRHGVLPQLQDYPADADWKALDPALGARALTLRNELPLSDSAIEFWENVDRDCVPQATSEQAGKCGYLAWALAADPKQTAWNLVALLKKHHDEAITRAAASRT